MLVAPFISRKTKSQRPRIIELRRWIIKNHAVDQSVDKRGVLAIPDGLEAAVDPLDRFPWA